MRRTSSIPAGAVLSLTLLVAMGGLGCSRRTSTDAGAGSGTVPAAVTSGSGSGSIGTEPTTAAAGAAGSIVGGTGSPTTTPVAPVRPAVEPKGTTTEYTIHTPDGRDRTYHLYVPASLPTDRPVPLLLAFHGGTGWATQYETQSGFDGVAEANGFLVAYPDGIKIPLTPKSQVWNAGACCGAAAQDRDNVDDVAFSAAVIDQIEGTHDIDKTRVYAAGHSNGAMMSIRLACELSDKIVAIGVQSGTLEIDQCHPSQKVSVLEIHGTADRNVPIAGGQGDVSISRVDYRPPVETMQTFAAVNGCPATPTESVDPANADIVTASWAPCQAGTAVQWVKVTGANHAWMGHPASSVAAEKTVSTPYLGIDSTLTIWTFLAAHPRPLG